MAELNQQDDSNALITRTDLEKAVAESEIYWRQTLRKCIKGVVKRMPLTIDKFIKLAPRLKSIEEFVKEPNFVKEVHQAVHILMMQKEIELNDDGEYIVPGTTPVKQRFRSLDAPWDH